MRQVAPPSEGNCYERYCGKGFQIECSKPRAGSFSQELVSMQFAKDSFLLALQQRLAGLNPARTVTINGATLPAVLAPENLPPASAEPQPNTFYIEWGSAGVIDGHAGN